MTADALLTPEELAKRWDVTTRTLMNYRNERTGPQFIVLGRNAVRYRMADVLAHEARKTTGGELPLAADAAIRRAADVFDTMTRWTLRPETLTTIETMRDELRAQLKKEK